MKRKMVQAVLEMSEYNRFSKGIFGWVGFRTKWLQYDNIERSAGKPSVHVEAVLNIRWRELLDFQWHRSHWLR